MHLAALVLAAEGTPVFPCRPGAKEPATRHGFKDRTTNTESINAWWTENPDYNIGIVPADKNLTIIDLDGPEGWTSWVTEYDWQSPVTYRVRTPSGGLHLYYIGNVRPTSKILGPKVDTRGEDSYVLAPPSYVEYTEGPNEGKSGYYEVIDPREPVPLPDCIIEALAAVKVEHKAAKTDDMDTDFNTTQAIDYLWHRAPIAVEGDGGDTATYQVAAAVRDYGISQSWCLHLMADHWNDRCAPPWDDEDLEAKVAHAYEYAQNAAGSRAMPQEELDSMAALAAELRAQGKVNTVVLNESISEERKPYQRIKPSEGEALPELTYWDPLTKTLPRVIGGAAVIIYGEFGSHKTNVTLTMVLDAVLGQGAKAVFAAGEGAHGLLKDRIPAHCRARGIRTLDLDETFGVVREVPLLARPEQVSQFLEAQADLKPDIVVLDTFATAISGVDENSSEAAQFLTGNGTVGMIRRAYDATVILPAHMGKDRSKGIRGNSGFGGNADVVIACEADKDLGLIKLTVEKMRDGRDGFSLYYAVEKDGIPVPVQITEQTYNERRGRSATIDDDQGKRLSVKLTLQNAKADRFMAGLNDRQLAERMIGPMPAEDEEEAERRWLSMVEKQRAALRGARNHERQWTVGMGSQEVSHEGARLEWRWWYQGQ